MTKQSVIDKASRDKPVWLPLDPDKKSFLAIHHIPSGKVILTRGWTLNDVLSIMGWPRDDVWAVFKRPWARSRGAVDITPGVKPDLDLSKLNEQGE